MFATASQLRRIARPLLGVLLFAQGVVAMENCSALEADPVQAFAAGMDMSAMMDDDGTPCQMNVDDNKNACFVHCSQGDQVHSAQAVMPFLPASTPVLVLDNAVEPAILHAAPLQELAAINSGPPIPIRFCSFLI
ncbi:MAG TPA: hypothetical protein VIU93_09235 [Gallionellaceae bacterium]